jgi:fatty acid desaturase
MSTTVHHLDYPVKPENHQVSRYKKIINEYLSKEEIRALHEKSNWKAFLAILSVWGWIAFSFALVGFFPNILTVIVALFIIGGKQLGCAIIMHDTGHYSLFKTKRLNNIIGNWFGAYPIFHNVEQYRPYHFQHHIATGTTDDPDMNLVTGYPVTKASLSRKVARDLFGPTGVKTEFGVFAMHLGYIKYNLGNFIERIAPGDRPFPQVLRNAYYNLRGPIAANLILFLILFASGHPLLYLLWPGALLTTYNFSLRVRSIAEHSVVEDTSDPYKNTRTTYANFIERILFAPLNVNYHLEHHFLQNAPSYNAPKMHELLKARGFYGHGLLKQNYWEVIKMAIVPKN